MATKKTTKSQNNTDIKSNTTSPSPAPTDNLSLDNPEKDYKVVFVSEDNTNDEEVKIITAESIQKQSEQWMYQALQHFDNGGRQYSVMFNENTSSSDIGFG